MPKYIEMSLTDVVHESEIFGVVMPPKTKQEQENPAEEVQADGKLDPG